MDSARTCWAEGKGLSEEQVEDLTLVAEESDRRLGEDRRDSLPRDPCDWAGTLESLGQEDLAERVRQALD